MPKKHYHLCLEERQRISELSQQGKTQTEIATAIGRSQSTISKELARNRGDKGYYHRRAEDKAEQRKARKPTRSRVINGDIEKRVRELFELSMTPGMIAMQMTNENTPVSHQTIYTFVVDDRREGGDLYKKLRKNSPHRKRKKRTKGGQIANRVSIEERPKVINDRCRYGDWEADLIDGKTEFILSLYERKSRFAIITKLPNKKASTTSAAIVKQLQGYKVHSITYDNGLEFAHHQFVSEALSCSAYFCAPYHSWEKGGVENFNRNVRCFLPKGTDFTYVTEAEVKQIQNTINRWPKIVISKRPPVDYEGWLRQ